MNYKFDVIPNLKDLINLYSKSNLRNYIEDDNKLMEAFNNSQIIITVWKETELVGLLRAITDYNFILYVQDIIVLPEYQCLGIGTNLLNIIKEKYSNINQLILIADNDKFLEKFYTKNNLIKLTNYSINSYGKILWFIWI